VPLNNAHRSVYRVNDTQPGVREHAPAHPSGVKYLRSCRTGRVNFGSESINPRSPQTLCGAGVEVQIELLVVVLAVVFVEEELVVVDFDVVDVVVEVCVQGSSQSKQARSYKRVPGGGPRGGGRGGAKPAWARVAEYNSQT
jgi:hypothetical protein